MANRMKNVWTEFDGAITRPAPGPRPSRPSRPFRRLADSSASSPLVVAIRRREQLHLFDVALLVHENFDAADLIGRQAGRRLFRQHRTHEHRRIDGGVGGGVDRFVLRDRHRVGLRY
jgi:hypothetical protein